MKIPTQNQRLLAESRSGITLLSDRSNGNGNCAALGLSLQLLASTPTTIKVYVYETTKLIFIICFETSIKMIDNY